MHIWSGGPKESEGQHGSEDSMEARTWAKLLLAQLTPSARYPGSHADRNPQVYFCTGGMGNLVEHPQTSGQAEYVQRLWENGWETRKEVDSR